MAFNTASSDPIFLNALVIDNSVMMRWLFDDGSASDQQYAQTTLHLIRSRRLPVIVPYIWVYESAFVVRYYVKQGKISYKEGHRHLEALFDLCHVIRGEELPRDLFAFAHAQGLSAYDASYLMLALQQNSPIATLDKEIIRAARKLEIEILV